MRHRAWLCVTPEKQKQSRLARALKLTEETGVQAQELTMPPIVGFDHIADYLFEIGPACGEHELTHAELRAWQENTGIELTEFEARALKILSREYLAAAHEARNPEMPQPYRTEATPEQKRAASLAMKNRRKNA